jgi:tetratricopeptide (TPR) repeat protein
MPIEVAIIFMLALLTFRLLTTVIHELGHAIPALLLTNEKVTVYMGSLGNPEKSLQFQLGRLECFFKFNLFYWKGGLCVMHEKDISVRTSFLVTICGPLLSLIVATIGIFILYYNQFSDVSKLVIFALVFSCLLDFINNMVPKRDSIALHNGTFTNNDGMQLWMLFQFRKSYQKFQKGSHYMEQSEFGKAAAIFEEAILQAKHNAGMFYRLAIYAHIQNNNREKAKQLQEAFTEKHKDTFTADDFMNAGIIHGFFEEYKKGNNHYTEALRRDSKNSLALNNRGYNYGLLHEHEKAIADLDKAISLNPKFAFAWNNRGFSKLKLGQLEAGLQDIQQSLQLDEQNSYAYRNLGLYHFYKKKYKKALELYEKAKELDASTKFIDDYINDVKKFVKI